MRSTNGLSFVLLAGSLSLLRITYGAPVEEVFNDKYDIFEKPSLLEGDMAGLIPAGKTFATMEEESEFLTAAARNGVLKGRWAGSKLLYEISLSFSAAEHDLILGAIAEINDNADHLVLTPRIDEPNYVFIGRGAANTGCWSYVGNIEVGRQVLNLQAPTGPQTGHCIRHGIIVHELNHAVGFFHEQSRTDRDDFVDINWANIEPTMQHNFNKYGEAEVTHFGVPYDTRSLMHYQRFDFAIDRTVWTIRPKAPNQDEPVGQSAGLSANDILKINAMYSS